MYISCLSNSKFEKSCSFLNVDVVIILINTIEQTIYLKQLKVADHLSSN